MILKKPLFIIYLTALLFFMGIVWLGKLDVSLYPDADLPVARTIMHFEGASSDFSETWGRRIERSIKSLEGIDYVEANYSQDKVYYLAYIKWKSDVESTKKEIESVVSFFASQLPEYLDVPITDVVNAGTENYLVLRPFHHKLLEFSQLVNKKIIPQVESIEGVSRSQLIEPFESVINIELNPYRLFEYKLNIDEIKEILKAQKFNYDLGRFESSYLGNVVVQNRRRISKIGDVENIIVGKFESNPIYLKDIATVSENLRKNDRAFSLGGNEVLALGMWPDSSSNLYEVSNKFQDLVERELAEIAEVVTLNDPSDFIQKAVKNIVYSVLLGVVSSAIVVFIFYRRFSSALLICMSMPLAIGISFLIMDYLNVTINILSIGAIGISIGMVVDSSILVIDFIEHENKNGTLTVKKVKEVINNVLPTIMTSVLTSIVIYIPLIFTEPLAASLLSDIALVAIAILLVSLFVSLVFIPSIYIQFISKMRVSSSYSKPFSIRGNKVNEFLYFFYRKRGRSILIFLSVLLMSTIVLFKSYPLVKKEVIAQPKAEIIDVGMSFNVDGLKYESKLALVNEVNNKVNSALKGDIKTVYLDIRKNVAYVSIRLKSYTTVEENLATLRSLIKSNDEYHVEIEPWITSSLKVATKSHLTIFFTGREQARLNALRSYEYLKKHNFVEKTYVTPRDVKKSSLDVELRESLLAQVRNSSAYGADLKSALNYVKYSVEPKELFQVYHGEDYKTLLLSLGDANKSDIRIEELPVMLGKDIYLFDDLFVHEYSESWRDIYSYNGREGAKLELYLKKEYLDSKNIEKLVSELAGFLGRDKERGDVSFVTLNNYQETEKTISSLVTTVSFSVLLVLLVLLHHFGTFGRSMICLSSVLFSFSGAVWVLYIFDCPLSLNAMLGVMILTGLSVNNSIIIIDRFDQCIQLGTTKLEAVVESVNRRWKALCVTNLTTILGMIPLAIGFGPAKDIIKPLGVTVCFGLLLSTLLSIFAVPAMLRIFYCGEDREEASYQYNLS